MKTATSAMVLTGILFYVDLFVNLFLVLLLVELEKNRGRAVFQDSRV